MKLKKLTHIIILILLVFAITSCDKKKEPQNVNENPILNVPPQEEEPDTVDGHGIVHRGRTDVTLPNDVTRPYIYIWFVPSSGNECGTSGTYRWYQFVHLRFYINGQEKQVKDSIKGATGLNYKFGMWNPDYHKEDPQSTGPGFTPSGLGLDNKNSGKPFKHYDIPGTRTAGGTSPLTGILDSPDFCNRNDKNTKQSPIERLLGGFLNPKEKEALNQPPSQEVNVRVVVEVRSYLVCVQGDQAHCIGYVDWTSTNDARIRLVWRESGTVLGTNKKWKVGSEFISVNYTLTIGGWHEPC